ncbi:MAG TPA: hypothetical protein VGL07_17820 [Buttiauxella sp.]|jgi:hypothetical protein
MMTESVINFRCDRATHERAKARLSVGAVKLPDILRLAVKSVADDSATVLNEVLKECGKEYAVGINSAWLYYKAHELFTYDEGVLYRNSNKGAGVRGAAVDIVNRAGVSCVVINGEYYPVKDVIWLMFYGHVSGDVVCVEGDSLKISNLIAEDESAPIAKIEHNISSEEKDLIKSGKMRALVIETNESERRKRGCVELLCNTGETFYLMLSDEKGWCGTRSAIHAQRLELNKFVISIS